MNPVSPNDEKHINMVMKSYDGSSTEQQSDFFYDFTVRRQDAITQTTYPSAFKPATTDLTIGATFQWDMKMKSGTALYDNDE